MKIPLEYNTEYAFLTNSFEIHLLKIHPISYQINYVSIGFYSDRNKEIIWEEFDIDDFNKEVVALLGEV